MVEQPWRPARPDHIRPRAPAHHRKVRGAHAQRILTTTNPSLRRSRRRLYALGLMAISRVRAPRIVPLGRPELPFSSRLADEDVQYVAEALSEAVAAPQ